MVYAFGLFGLFFILILILELKEYKKASQTGKKRIADFWKGRLRKIFILGILFFVFLIFIAYPTWDTTSWEARRSDATAQADAKNAYTAAQAYFTDYPGSTISLSKLTSYGYRQSSEVNLAVLSGSKSNLKITAFHPKGKKTFTVDSNGNITSQEAVNNRR